MFDTAKVQLMTEGLIRFSQEHDNLYVVPEFFDVTSWALFRRLQFRIRAILLDVPLYNGEKPLKELFGVPVLNTSEAATNFNERTGIIVLRNKKTPFIKTNLSFTVNDRLMGISAFFMNSDEVLAVYDRLTLLKVMQQYREDGLPVTELNDLAMHFARGLTTFLDPDTQNVKFQLWDRNYFVAPKYDVDDTAIVLRGQVVYENRYTEKTLEFYRSVYPNAPIVVSTWKNELTDSFRAACKKFSVVLLENIQPTTPGWGHINYQLENAFKGVDYVKENLNAKFVLLTRTDQRLNKFDFLLYFRNMISEFPPHGKKLQGRILLLGTWLTKKYLPFCITDFLAFGYIADIFKFYGMAHLKDSKEFSFCFAHKKKFFQMRKELGQRTFVKYDFTKNRTNLRKFNRVINKFVYTDSFWMKNFYRNHIAPIDETTLLETWWKFIREYLIFADIGSVIFDWSKNEDQRRYGIVMEGADFSQWLDLYRNFNVDWL